MNAEHPELGMTAIDDIWPQENFYFRSDHYNFAKRGVPVLFFFNGTHADYHAPGDGPERIDAERKRGSCGSSTTSAAKSATPARARNGTTRATARS